MTPFAVSSSNVHVSRSADRLKKSDGDPHGLDSSVGGLTV